MNSATLVKNIALLTLIVSGSAIAEPKPETTQTESTENIVFTLNPEQPSSCQPHPILHLKVTRGEAIRGKKSGHHANLVPMADSPPYDQVVGTPHRDKYDPSATTWSYTDKVTSKDGKVTLILKGVSNSVDQTNTGTWTDNSGCSGTFVDTKATSLTAP